MGFLKTLTRPPENRSRMSGSSDLGSPEAWLMRLMGGVPTTAGVTVDEFSAMNLSTVYACIRNISEDVAKLPIGIFTTQDGKKNELVNNELTFILNEEPADGSTAIAFREALTAHAIGWGRGIAEIEWLNNGRPGALWLQRPDNVRMERRNGTIWYEFGKSAITGNTTAVKDDNVIHIHGLGFDGVTGYSVVQKARESLGLTAATEKFGGAFFGNGGVPSGLLTHPGKLSPEAAKRLKENWDEKNRGPANARGTSVLEEGLDYKPIGISQEDSQFLQTRQFQATEICRWFRMPPHKIADLARGTFSNIEHQSIEYVTDCLLPWLLRWEQEINRKFFGGPDPRYVKHNVASLLRGDILSRYQAYAIGRQWGWLSADDVLALEDRNPIAGGAGAVYLSPGNMVPANRLDEVTNATIAKSKQTPGAPPPANPNNGNQNRAKLIESSRALLADTAYRLQRVEADKLNRNSKRADFDAWQETFYREHLDEVRGAFFPVAELLSEATGMEAKDLALTMATRHITHSRSEVRALGHVSAASEWHRHAGYAAADAEIHTLTTALQTRRNS